VEKLEAGSQFSTIPTAHRDNRIHAIHGSLAVEQNILSLELVTAVLNGERVLAPSRDIVEVKNAYEIYEWLDELDPCSMNNLLTAHGIMIHDLVVEYGAFGNQPVGIVYSGGRALHFGPLSQDVPALANELLDRAIDSQIHMPIRSCVFHYGLEFIHPFADGNGRVGRLWHILLLSKWNSAFTWLPVESIIHDRQQEYYATLNGSNSTGNLLYLLSSAVCYKGSSHKGRRAV